MSSVGLFQVAKYPVVLTPVSDDQKHADKDHDQGILVFIEDFKIRKPVEFFC
jgi:hypothetical protein